MARIGTSGLFRDYVGPANVSASQGPATVSLQSIPPLHPALSFPARLASRPAIAWPHRTTDHIRNSRARSTLSNCSSVRLKRALIDLDPFTAKECQAFGLCQEVLESRVPKGFLPQGSPPTGNQATTSMPSCEGALPPIVALTCGRGGRFIPPVAGIRTTTPALSRTGNVSQEAAGAAAELHRSG